MKVNKKLDGTELLLEIDGSVDSSTAPELSKEVNESIKGVTLLVFDFSKVDYVSSAGLRVLLVAFKTMSKQGKMIIRHVNQDIMDVFSITGFDSILTIEN